MDRARRCRAELAGADLLGKVERGLERQDEDDGGEPEGEARGAASRPAHAHRMGQRDQRTADHHDLDDRHAEVPERAGATEGHPAMRGLARYSAELSRQRGKRIAARAVHDAARAHVPSKVVMSSPRS